MKFHGKKILKLICIFIAAVVVFGALVSTAKFPEVIVEKEVLVPVILGKFTRLEINNVIAENQKEFIKLYATHLNISERVSRNIIENSLEYNMPLNLMFALGYTESEFRMVYNYNEDSFDYGIFQLNSKTYPNLLKDYGTIEANVRQGIYHYSLEVTKNSSYDLSIMTYNCGSLKRVHYSLDHLKRALDFERELDEWFNSIYRNKISRDFSRSKI